MNNKAIFSLSDYQRAMLSAMGISAWCQHVSSVPSSKSEALSLTENKNKAEPLVEGASLASDLSKPTFHSLPEHVLYPEHVAAHPLFRDILSAIGLQEKPRRAIENSSVEQYSDYLLAWKIADNIALDGTTLTTPDLSKLSSVAAKKQLWRALQAYTQQDSPA